MFGSLTITLDKGVLLASVAVAIAFCACVILKNGIERLINGDLTPHQNDHARKKGFLLTIVSLALLTGSIIAILESENLVQFLSKQIKIYKQSIQEDK